LVANFSGSGEIPPIPEENVNEMEKYVNAELSVRSNVMKSAES